MKYIAMTVEGRIPVAARVTDEHAEKMVAGVWHYVTKSKYQRIKAQHERWKAEQRLQHTLPQQTRPQPKRLALAINRTLH